MFYYYSADIIQLDFAGSRETILLSQLTGLGRQFGYPRYYYSL